MLADVIFILKYFTNSILFLYNDIEFLLTISSFSWSPVLGIQFFYLGLRLCGLCLKKEEDPDVVKDFNVMN